jgi:hypothetical protein
MKYTTEAVSQSRQQKQELSQLRLEIRDATASVETLQKRHTALTGRRYHW